MNPQTHKQHSGKPSHSTVQDVPLTRKRCRSATEEHAEALPPAKRHKAEHVHVDTSEEGKVHKPPSAATQAAWHTRRKRRPASPGDTGSETFHATKRRLASDASLAACLPPGHGSSRGVPTDNFARKRRLTETSVTEDSSTKKQRRDRESCEAAPSSARAPAGKVDGYTAGQPRKLSSCGRDSHPEVTASKRCTRWRRTQPRDFPKRVRSGESNEQDARRRLQSLGVHLLGKHEIDAMTRLKRTPLGHGGYGTCFLTVHPPTGEALVVKSFFGNSLKHLLTEAETLHLLQGEGIQRLFGVCLETRRLVTHYAGATAKEYLIKHPPFGAKVSILLQVARSLQSMHRRGYTHNDLKEGNLCVASSPDGPVATVIDFGLARRAGMPGLFCGVVDRTPFKWMAPELFGYVHPNSEASDAFSLAVLMQAMNLRKGCLLYATSLVALTYWERDALHPDPTKRPALAEAVRLLQALLEGATRPPPSPAYPTSSAGSLLSPALPPAPAYTPSSASSSMGLSPPRLQPRWWRCVIM